VSEGRPTALVIHGQADVLDLLTRWIGGAGLDVVAAATSYRAQAALEGVRAIDVVVAPWDLVHPLGGDVYRWALAHRPDLRNRFVFVGDEVPPEFDAVVGGRCLAVPLGALDEIARIAAAIVQTARTPVYGVPSIRDRTRPTLLLVDDDPPLLSAMAGLLEDEGYFVTAVDSGSQATEVLEMRDFDALVVDWHMHDGSGADVYRWVLKHKPRLAARVVFLAEADQDDSGPVAPGRPMFRKGQDSQALTDGLRKIVSSLRSG
jgi:CheY-like chemotaxis protein